jgi:hypothetical protein
LLPHVDRALQNGVPGGLSKNAIAQLCRGCSIVLMHRSASPAREALWASKKDPWQVRPDYAFWAPGTEAIASNQRSAQVFVNRNCTASVEYCYPSQGSYSWAFYQPPHGGGGGGSGPPPIPYATEPEVPDSPDGPGHGPAPDMSLPQDSACPGGYFLAFESGSGPYGGGVYCAVDFSSVPDSAQVAQVFWLDSVDVIHFADQHFWNRHLACYVHNVYTRVGIESQVFYPDFEARSNKPTAAAPFSEYAV